MKIDIDDKIRFIVLDRDAKFSLKKIQRIIGGIMRTLNFSKKHLESGENIFNVKEGRGGKKNKLCNFSKNRK